MFFLSAQSAQTVFYCSYSTRLLMPTLRSSPPKQFMQEMGSLLANRALLSQSEEQRAAVVALGAYTKAARAQLNLTVADLTARSGLHEPELYALEHGLLPFTQLTRPFLQSLATACEDDVEILIALLDATQHKLTAQKPYTYSTPPPSPHNVGGNSITRNGILRRLANTKRLFWQWRGHSRAWWPMSQPLGMPHGLRPVISTAVFVVVCSVSLFQFFQLPGSSIPQYAMSPAVVTVAGTASSTTAIVDYTDIDNTDIDNTDIDKSNVNRTIVDRKFVRSKPYEIVFQAAAADRRWDNHSQISPAIPVKENQTAKIQLTRSVPDLVILCQPTGHLISCPM